MRTTRILAIAMQLFVLIEFLPFSTCNALRRSDFPDSFIFGTSTSSFQIEGAYLDDRKSLSNWDVFSHIPGHIQDAANADIADDHYHLYLEKQGGSVGIVVGTDWFEPLRNITADYEACRRASAFYFAWFLDPFVRGDYPPEMRQILGGRLPKFSTSEKKKLRNKLDFIGINHYSSLYVKDCMFTTCDVVGPLLAGFAAPVRDKKGVPIGKPTAKPNFYVVPRGMKNIVMYMKRRYNNMPMIITENGYPQGSYHNTTLKELLNDKERVEYLQSYLSSLHEAMRQGADVRGYFIWSLIDNFEWLYGYSMRFGLYHVDYETQVRTPKLSADWYRKFIGDAKLLIKKDMEEDGEIIVM